MKSDKNGTSTCPPGEEQYEIVKLPGRIGRTYVQYDFRHPDGELFSTTASTLALAREKRDKWIQEKDGPPLPMASRPVKDLMKKACAEIQQLTEDRDMLYPLAKSAVIIMEWGGKVPSDPETRDLIEKFRDYENRPKRSSACKKFGQVQRVHNRKTRSKQI